jgi:hypothetical protein
MNVAHAENFASRVHRSTWISLLVWLLFALTPLIVFALGCPDRFQWDFHGFYSAGMTVKNGYDPYDSAQREAVFPGPGSWWQFFYPPLTLSLFTALTALPYGMACLLWLGLKLSALVLLFVIWHKGFEPLNPRYPLVLFFLLGYAGTIYQDVRAGNIVIFEQLGLWLGFLFLIGKRYLLFGLCIAVISQFKLQPIVFLGLLLIIEERPRWFEFGISLAFFVALLSLGFLLYPALISSFIGHIAAGGGNLFERAGNPSLLALIQSVTDIVPKTYQLPKFVDIVVYIVAVFGVLSTFLYFFVAYRKKHPNYDLRILVYAACFVYTVTAARMRDYSYIICLLPTLAMLRRRKDELELVPIAAVLVFAAPIAPGFPFVGTLSKYFYAYLPLLAAGMMLWLHLDEFRKLSGAAAGSGSSPAVRPGAQDAPALRATP